MELSCCAETGHSNVSARVSTQLIPRSPLVAKFDEIADRWHSRTAIQSRDRSLSYRELSNCIQAAALMMQHEHGVRGRDRVMLLLPNSAEYVIAFYATLAIGAIPVPLPPDVESGRLEQIARVAAPVLAIACGPSISRLKKRGRITELSTSPGPTAIAAPANGAGRLCWTAPAEHAAAADHAIHDELACVIFTSGSTGAAKGVMLSHKNLLSNAAAIAEYLNITEQDRALAVLPFYHAFGNSVLQSHLLRGATLVLSCSAAFPEALVDELIEQAATSLSGVPELFDRLLTGSLLRRRQFPALRYLAIAGGGLAPHKACDLASQIGPERVFAMYGQTEATARLSYLHPADRTLRSGSIGRGLSHTELRIFDESGAPVATGIEGDVWARGPGIMLGYLGDAEATARTLRGEWLITGDRGYADDDGYVYLTGRANQLMKINGYRVHPREVESLIEGIPGIDRAVAVPYSANESLTRIALYVTLTEANSAGVSDGLPMPQQLLAACRREFPAYKVPSYVEILEAWPVNSSTKIDRAELALRASDVTLCRTGREDELASTSSQSDYPADRPAPKMAFGTPHGLGVRSPLPRRPR